MTKSMLEVQLALFKARRQYEHASPGKLPLIDELVSKVGKLLGEEDAQHGKEGPSKPQDAGSKAAANKRVAATLRKQDFLGTMSQVMTIRDSLSMDEEFYDIMSHRILARERKKETLRDLEKQAAAYMKEMVAGLCSGLYYSDTTITELADQFCVYAGGLKIGPFMELVSELPGDMDDFMQWLRERPHHETLFNNLKGIIKSSTETDARHQAQELHESRSGIKAAHPMQPDELPDYQDHLDIKPLEFYLERRKDTLLPSDSKDAALHTKMGSGVEQEVVQDKIKVGEEELFQKPAAAAPPSGHGGGSPPAAACVADESPHTPSPQPPEESESDLEPRELKFLTPAPRREEEVVNQVSGGGSVNKPTAAVPPSGSPTLAASIEGPSLPQPVSDAPWEGEHIKPEPEEPDKTEDQAGQDSTARKPAAVALHGPTARAFADLTASVTGFIMPVPSHDTIKGGMEEVIGTSEGGPKALPPPKVASDKKAPLAAQVTPVAASGDGDAGAAAVDKMADVDKGKAPAAIGSDADEHGLEDELEELEEGSHDNIPKTASEEKKYREMLGLSETDEAALHVPGEEEVSSRPKSPQGPLTRSAARKQRQIEEAKQDGHEQDGQKKEHGLQERIFGNQGHMTASAGGSARPRRTASAPSPLQTATTAGPGGAEAARVHKEQGRGKPPRPPAPSQAHTTITPAMRGLAVSSNDTQNAERKANTVQRSSKKTPGEGATQRKQQESAARADRAGGSSSSAKDAGLSQQGKICVGIWGYSDALKGAEQQAEKKPEKDAAAAGVSRQLGMPINSAQIATLNRAFGVILKSRPKKPGYQRYSLNLQGASGSRFYLVSRSPRSNWIEVDIPRNAALKKMLQGIGSYQKADTYEEVEAFFSSIGLDLLPE
ncbi:hypothetical protein COCOBI_11-2110 [Coccomyxa sp. Obi]|nr:hypothetical protein COCOBI_11-2110 [Coccomyxa sp. Obi]